MSHASHQGAQDGGYYGTENRQDHESRYGGDDPFDHKDHHRQKGHPDIGNNNTLLDFIIHILASLFYLLLVTANS